VRAESLSGRDWRDAAAYAPLLCADRSLFAWEWLRRDCAYRAAWSSACSAGGAAQHAAAATFGLVAFEPPHLAVPDARPLWRREVHPYVLPTEASGRGGSADCFDVERLGPLRRLAAVDGCEHLLLSDGLRAVRLDAPRGTFTAGPVRLGYSLAGLASAEPPLLALRRFLALCRTGRFAASLHPRQARARRWILLLRAFDALEQGADQRRIAGELLSPSAGETRWRTREPSVRSQAQRLVRAARRMAGGGYRELLLG